MYFLSSMRRFFGVIPSGILYGSNIRAVLDDEKSVNLGSVYESVVASELIAHGYQLFYYPY